jgi:pantoate--beta-alanine ligase
MTPFAVEPEYLALVDPDTMEPVTHLHASALLAVAAHVGSTRLIDNLILDPSAVPSSVTHSGKAMTTCSA